MFCAVDDTSRIDQVRGQSDRMLLSLMDLLETHLTDPSFFAEQLIVSSDLMGNLYHNMPYP